MSEEKSYQMDVINEDNIYLCFSCGSANIGFLTSQYHGCSMKNECCCFMHEFCFLDRAYLTCCDKQDSHYIRLGCFCDAFTFKKTEVCCKQQCHSMCLVCSFSIPPDNEVPCVLACCSVVLASLECKMICKNCMTFGQIRE